MAAQRPGFTREDALRIRDELIANNAILDTCPLHDFSEDATPQKAIFKTWRCVRCRGQVDAVKKHWYERGVRDAQGKA